MTNFHTWPRLYVSNDLSQGSDFELSLEQSHYLFHVMRAQEGESVRLFNGQDGEWLALLKQAPKGKKTGALVSPYEQHKTQIQEPDLWLCCAPIKRAHFDFMIMKATELGVSVIQPILTGRTQVRDVNVERCFAIAQEAAEQAERLSLPQIKEAVTLDRVIKNWPEKRLPIVCAEFGEAQPIHAALASGLAQSRKQAAIFTGPEGGFLPEELALLQSLPEALAVRLGPRILRADTAALAALSCWQAQCGDWNHALSETSK